MKLIRWAILACFTLVVVGSLLPGPYVTAKIPGQYKLDHEPNGLILRACADCHSNATHWPWYAHVAPVSWALEHDVLEGRKFMNFSQWSDYGPAGRSQLLTLSAAQLESGAMPPARYLALHPDARLTATEKSTLITWMKDPSNQK